jgi:putative Mn2+ efflux pump MntP
MEQFFDFAQILAGVLFILIGFKIINPFRGKQASAEGKEWNAKYEKKMKRMKIIGILLLMFSGVQFLMDGITNESIWTQSYKDSMTQACFESAIQNVSDTLRVDKYCNCVTEQVATIYTKSSFDSIQKMSNEEQLKVYQPIIEMCK